MQQFQNFEHPYKINSKYRTKVAYFCMEFGIDQALKIYSGGLGYLAGSHIRSAYHLKQNLIGIGILWKYGYYDQTRAENQDMNALFIEKNYSFLEDTGIVFTISVNRHPVKVKVWYLAPEVFGTAPLFLLSTQVEGNDYLARTICHRLYSDNTNTKIAQYILLGKGGAQLLEALNYKAAVYHMNEAHALPAAFHLYEKYRDVAAVKQKMVFTTHTPVKAGNEKHDFDQLHEMSFFGDLPKTEVRRITGVEGNVFNQSLVAFRLSRLSNGVSKMHGETARRMWSDKHIDCEITHITNAQNYLYWHDPALEKARTAKTDRPLIARKKALKQDLFKVVADQTGKLFSPDVLTMVWARRFAGYKRANLITRDFKRFEQLIYNSKHPIQIIWAGKPYPTDFQAVAMFNDLIHLSKKHPNVAVLTGYELALSKLLKQGSDIWLNTPVVYREASGTSGMTAAMNASVNLSTMDGWIPEFAKHGENAFVVPKVNGTQSHKEVDKQDAHHIMTVLEEEILPTYYDQPKKWWAIVRNSMEQVTPAFGSDRMADDYYQVLYSPKD